MNIGTEITLCFAKFWFGTVLHVIVEVTVVEDDVVAKMRDVLVEVIVEHIVVVVIVVEDEDDVIVEQVVVGGFITFIVVVVAALVGLELERKIWVSVAV